MAGNNEKRRRPAETSASGRRRRDARVPAEAGEQLAMVFEEDRKGASASAKSPRPKAARKTGATASGKPARKTGNTASGKPARKTGNTASGKPAQKTGSTASGAAGQAARGRSASSGKKAAAGGRKAKPAPPAKSAAKPRVDAAKTKPAKSGTRQATHAAKTSGKRGPAKAATSSPKAGSRASHSRAKQPNRARPHAAQRPAQARLPAAGSSKRPARSGKATPRTPERAKACAVPSPADPHRGLYAALSLVFATAIAALALMGVSLIRQRGTFLEMKRVVENQTFYDGTTVEGVDVSNMTLTAAREYWGGKVEPAYAQRTVTLDDGETLTAAELGYASDYDSVLYNAWSAGRSGSLEARYSAAVSSAQSPAAYAVRRSLYSEKAVENFVQTVAAQVNAPAVDAAVSGFDLNTFQFSFSDAHAGAKLDSDALKKDIISALESGGGSVTRQIETLAPAATAEALSGQYGIITIAATNASSSSKNRLNNIKQALAYIHGTCLEPGETFSFNKVVGKRTTDRGFKVATAYSGGDVTEEVGGGICQVSTTLFNAAVKADLKIVERHNHSLTVAYVDSGKDATVNWNGQDLRFTNTTGDRLYICCYLTNDKRVRVGIFGKLLANGETITVEAKTTETIKFDTVYQASPDLAAGETKVVSAGKNGCKAVAYKIRWDASGNEIGRELLCKSAYRAKSEVVAYGA